jgi:hypothetical protein
MYIFTANVNYLWKVKSNRMTQRRREEGGQGGG